MKAALITLAFLVVVGLFGFGFWASYQEVQNPAPTAHPMTEIELDAHQMDVQLEHQKDATSKISAVAMAGYSTIARDGGYAHDSEIYSLLPRLR